MFCYIYQILKAILPNSPSVQKIVKSHESKCKHCGEAATLNLKLDKCLRKKRPLHTQPPFLAEHVMSAVRADITSDTHKSRTGAFLRYRGHIVATSFAAFLAMGLLVHNKIEEHARKKIAAENITILASAFFAPLENGSPSPAPEKKANTLGTEINSIKTDVMRAGRFITECINVTDIYGRE